MSEQIDHEMMNAWKVVEGKSRVMVNRFKSAILYPGTHGRSESLNCKYKGMVLPGHSVNPRRVVPHWILCANARIHARVMDTS